MKKIVLADDEQFIAKAYKEGLSRAGFEVETAADGTTALELVTKNKPDLVLLDLIMPGMTGFEVLKKIKENKDLEKIPVMILSNLSQETDKNEAMNLGATDFIIKSDASLKEVISKVSDFLNKK